MNAPNMSAAPPRRMYTVSCSPPKKFRYLPIPTIITVMIGEVRRITAIVEFKMCSNDIAIKKKVRAIRTPVSDIIPNKKGSMPNISSLEARERLIMEAIKKIGTSVVKPVC